MKYEHTPAFVMFRKLVGQKAKKISGGDYWQLSEEGDGCAWI